MTVCAWISIPAQVPFTLQTFAVFFVTALLGLKCGTLSVVVYLLLGAVGLPVFAGFQGEWGDWQAYRRLSAGFCFLAIAVGLITKFFGRSFPVLILSMIVGLILAMLSALHGFKSSTFRLRVPLPPERYSAPVSSPI